MLPVIVIAESFVNRISAHEPKLTYTAPESLPFAGLGKNVGIYQVEIANEGDKEAEALACLIRIPEANVDNDRVMGPEALAIDTKVEGDKVRVSAPTLNPGEIIHVSVLASSISKLPGEPDISVRAIGATGVQRTLGSPRRILPSVFSTIIIASAAILVILLLQLAFRRWRGNAASQTAEAKGWRNVADVFWLGHDLMWTFKQVVGNSPRERIFHGLKQSRHHAGQIGLQDTSAYVELDSMYSSVSGLSDGAITVLWRDQANKRVSGLITGFGALAKAQQPDFEPDPR